MPRLTPAEATLARSWRNGSPAAAMLACQDAGMTQADREVFLLKIGCTQAGLDTLELHRDSYLAWYRAELDADADRLDDLDRIYDRD